MSKKRTIKMPANELSDVDVRFVSLVNRPANRIPFRIMKAEKVAEGIMINVKNMLRLKRDEEQKPALAAVVIQKEHAEQILPQLEAHGLNIKDVTEADGLLVIKQGEYTDQEITPFKVNDEIVVFMKGVQKAFSSFPDSLSFDDNLKAAGFWPSMGMATEALLQTLSNVMSTAKDVTTAKSAIDTAMNQYHAYALSLVSSLPMVAFKLEDVTMAEIKKDEPVKTETTKAMNGDDKKCEAGFEWSEEKGACVAMKKKEDAAPEAPVEGAAKKEDAPAKEQTATTEEAVKTEAPAASTVVEEPKKPEGDAAAAAQGTEEVKKTEDGIAKLLEAMEAKIVGKIDALGKDVEALKGDSATVKDRLEKVETVAKSASEAVRGTVHSGSQSVDGGAPTPVKKSAGSLWDGTGLDKIIPG